MSCIVETEETKRLAKELNLDKAVALAKIQSWMTENHTLEYPTTEELKTYIKNNPATIKLNIIPGTKYDNIEYVPTLSSLAASNIKLGKIKLKKGSYTPQEIIDHLFGRGTQQYSDQKKKVMADLEKTFGITEEYMKEILINETVATSFVIAHEQSHIANSDSYDVNNYMSNNAIQTEARATLDAIKAIFPYVQNYFRNKSNSVQLFESEFAKYFEFGNNLPSVKSQIPDNNTTTEQPIQLSEELHKSINNFVNGIAPLTPESAIKFLEEIKEQNPELYENAKNKFNSKERKEVKEDVKESIPTQQSVPVQPQEDTDILNQQKEDIIRLTNSFTPQERHDRAYYLADMILEKANELFQDSLEYLENTIQKEEAKEVSAQRQEYIDKLKDRLESYQQKNGLAVFLMDLGISNVFDAVIQMFEENKNNQSLSEYERVQYQKILDNFRLLSEEACDIIEDDEGIKILIDSENSNIENHKTQQEQEEEDRDFEDDEAQNRVTGNDGWSFKIRFIDPFTTVSKEVKNILAHLYLIDHEGMPITDDLGRMRRLNAQHAHLCLLAVMSEVKDINEFYYKDENGDAHFPILEKAINKYPWVQQVMDKLSDPDNARIVSKFYKDLRQDFIHYYQQIFNEEKGIMQDSQCNIQAEVDSTLSDLLSNYTQGIQLTENSLYTETGKISEQSARQGVSIVSELNSLLEDFDEIQEITDLTVKSLKMLGFDVSEDQILNLIEAEGAPETFKILATNIENIFTNSIEANPESHLIELYKNYYTTIAKIIGTVSETNLVSSFRLGDKSLYSYSAPNYINTLIKNLKDGEKIESFVESEFGYDQWFKKNGQWRNGWIQELLDDEELRNNLEPSHLVIINEGIKDVDYENWTPKMIRKSFIIKYFSGGKKYGVFNFPILADAPVAMFIKFKKYTDTPLQTFEEQIISKLREVVLQELDRIALVKQRIDKGVQCIQNYDTGKMNGLKFNFFPELNDDTEFISACQQCIDNSDDEGLNRVIDAKLKSVMEDSFTEFLKNTEKEGIKAELMQQFVKDKLIEEKSEEGYEYKLKEYFYNQMYATTQIIELTTTDLAFYKDGTDFQKRFKEIYAAGYKLNTNSEYGKEFRTTVYLKDQIITSQSFNNIKESLNKAVELGHIQSYDRDNILNKMKDINVADAQSYISPDGLRSVLDMMGEWTDELETSLKRFENGSWDMSDFNAIYQTIKPFLYTQIATPDGIGNKIRVPHQNKNSEFMLMALYNLVSNSFNTSPELRAMQKFMRDNNIDTMQFESAVKVGGQGIIDISYSPEKLKNWVNNPANKKAVEELLNTKEVENIDHLYDSKVFKKANDALLNSDTISQKEYNKRINDIKPSENEVYRILDKETKIQQDEAERAATGEFGFDENNNPLKPGDLKQTVVHNLPYKDYCIQQPTKEHLFDAEVIFGSQFRNLIISDIDDNATFTVNGNKYTKKEIIQLYQALVVENLLDSYQQLINKFGTIEDFQRELLDSVRANDKFNRDIIQALQLVTVKDENGENVKVFNIPLNNMATTIKLQQVVTSFFKNRITKQNINGGACFLVSDFGLTQELHTLYKKDGSLEGVQCYLPASSRKFYEPFMIEKTNDKGEKYVQLDIESMPMEMRKLVGYRIPTEDKYSMVPLIIKGFLPQQNGSSIMLPADITQHAGSDFDIDKLFLMIPQFDVEYYDLEEAKHYYNTHVSLLSQVTNATSEEDLSEEFADFKTWWKKEKHNHPEFKLDIPRIRKIKYDASKKPEEQTGDRARQRAKRDNMIIDIAHSILCHPDTLEKFNNPGNFDGIVLQAAINDVVTDPAKLQAFMNQYGITSVDSVIKKLLNISKEGSLGEIQDFLSSYEKNFGKKKNFLGLDTFIYNHVQNTTGGKLIGMYANNTVAQAKYQNSSLQLKDEFIFKINNREIKSLHNIFSGLNERISKNCAQFSAASVDNVKNPVLAKLMQNTSTAGITAFMLRAGFSIEEINLLFQQGIIKELILNGEELKPEKLQEMIRDIVNAYGKEVLNKIGSKQSLTSEDLLRIIILQNNPKIANEMTDKETFEYMQNQVAALTLMQNILIASNPLTRLTRISRADSPNGAVPNSLAGYKFRMELINEYMNSSTYEDFPLSGVSDGMYNGYITPNMSINAMRRELLKRPMPMLQAFHSLGIEFVSTLLKYFPQNNEYTDDLLHKITSNTPESFWTFTKSSEKIINKFYREICEFALTKTTLFGDDANQTFEEKRNYFLNEFPNKMVQKVKDDSELQKMALFRKIVKNNKGQLELPKSGRINRKSSEFLMRDMEMLLYKGGKYAELAKNLFMYSFYKEGLWFGPNSINGLFSSTFLSAFPEYVNTLRFMGKNMKKGTFYDRFEEQFYANNYKALVPTYKIGGIRADDEIIMPIKSVWKRKDGKGSVYNYILVNYILYKREPFLDKSKDEVKYTKVPTLNIRKYNANMTVSEMKKYDVEPEKNKMDWEGFTNQVIPDSAYAAEFERMGILNDADSVTDTESSNLDFGEIFNQLEDFRAGLNNQDSSISERQYNADNGQETKEISFKDLPAVEDSEKLKEKPCKP